MWKLPIVFRNDTIIFIELLYSILLIKIDFKLQLQIDSAFDCKMALKGTKCQIFENAIKTFFKEKNSKSRR